MLIALVSRLSVNVPFWDEWELVPLLQKQAEGTLRFADLLAQHNEHRPFFPVLIALKLARITHWNIRAEVFLGLALAGALLLVLAFLIKRTVAPYGWGLAATGLVTASWLVLSPLQWENWLWGWQLEWFLCNLAAVASAALLTQWPDRRPAWLGVGLAAGAAVVASYSLAAGLCAWVAFLFMFVVRKRLRAGLVVWAAAAAGTVGLYFLHFNPSGGDLGFALRHPLDFVSYLLKYVSAPVSSPGWYSAFEGFLLVAAFAAATFFLAARHPEAAQRASVWVSLGLFTLLGAAITGVGRLQYGVAQSQSSRYTTLSTVFTLSTLMLVLIALGSALPVERRRTWGLRIAELAAMAVIALLIGANYIAGLKGLRGRHDVFAKGKACLVTVQTPSDKCLAAMGPNTDTEWTGLQYIRAHGLAGQRHG
jgi:hypothetical protein